MNNKMNRSVSGFTLIELMIVVAIIAIIAAVAIPSLLRSKLTANETSAQAALRTVCSAQLQLKLDAWVDENHNGVGEFGTFGQLAGGEPCSDGVTINHPYLRIELGLDVKGADFPLKSGYHFVMYLPDDIGQCEQNFVCYAWPMERGITGNKVFAVSEEGTVHVSLGAVTPYSGGQEGNQPDRMAAFVENELNPLAWCGRFPSSSSGEVGDDGNQWVVAGD